MELNTGEAVGLCVQAHDRLVKHIASLTDEQARRPSLLPDWTVGHVLTHIARNADGHTLRLEGALRGEEVARYPGGDDQRNGDIEAGAVRPAAELIADIAESNTRLEQMWQRSQAAGWPHAQLMATDRWPTTSSPIRRLREVEIHHVDLGMGYPSGLWSDEYTGWELRQLLSALPQRLTAEDSRRLVLWLTGRTEMPDVHLGPWS